MMITYIVMIYENVVIPDLGERFLKISSKNSSDKLSDKMNKHFFTRKLANICENRGWRKTN